MKRGTILLLIASAALAATTGWYVYRAMNAPSGVPVASGAAQQPQRVQTVNGETVVIVAPDMQHASRIDTEPLALSMARPQSSAYAAVIDLQALFDLHDRLIAARADRESAQAQVAASRAEYERSRVLFQDNRNVSRKSLESARAAMQIAQAKLQAAEAAQAGLAATLRRQFGDALASAATATASDLFQKLSTGRAVVLRVTLPTNNDAAAPLAITVEGPDGRPLEGRRLSASPQSDPAIQGKPYFYMANGAMPIGMHTIAHAPLDGKSTPGLLIPESAIVWYGGQPWVYVRTTSDHFTRRSLPSVSPIDGRLVVKSGFHVGDEVVIHGAQLLLSEELRPQGIATQCKDPPECDG
jgi:membrane fusion protein, multidrug efflux system